MMPIRGLTAGLRAFLAGLIDYAGMFPPANLGLEEALGNFIAYCRSEDAWMLGGFILPVQDVAQAAGILDSDPDGSPVRITMLGKGGPDWTSFFSGLDAEIDRIAAFRHRIGDRTVTTVFETRLPGAELDFQIRADALVAEAALRLNDAGLLPYFEVPPDPAWQDRTGRAIRSIEKTAGENPVRFKIRTGGVSAADFPSPEQLAWTLNAAREAGIALKCTAGLHHPIRQHRPEVETKMHGFINVFAAAILAAADGLSAEQIAPVLAEEDPAAFVFSEDGLAWRGLHASVEEIETARRQFAVSFGSCSFDDPREELRELGWR